MRPIWIGKALYREQSCNIELVSLWRWSTQRAVKSQVHPIICFNFNFCLFAQIWSAGWETYSTGCGLATAPVLESSDESRSLPSLSGCDAYLIFVIFFTRAKFLENKIYTEKTRKLQQNTQKIAIFLCYYGKIHSKLPIFRIKFVKIYTGHKKITQTCPWRPWQISGM